jgi:hypothetical protein
MIQQVLLHLSLGTNSQKASRSDHESEPPFHSPCAEWNDEPWRVQTQNSGLWGRNPGFSLADTDDLLVGKSLLDGDVLM